VHIVSKSVMQFNLIFTDAKPIVSAEITKEEISPYWSFNETADISKYEDFDHKKFLGNYKYIKVFIQKHNLFILCDFIIKSVNVCLL